MNPTTRRGALASLASIVALVTARLQTARAAFNAFGTATQVVVSPPPVITTPTLFLTAAPGTTHVTSGASTTGTTLNCPAGSTVVVHINAQASGTVATLVDSAGNTYSLAGQAVGATSHDCELWYCAHCLALSAGGTFRATTVLGGTYTISGAVYFTGADTLDQTVTLDTSGTGYTLTTPTLTAANQIAFGANVDSIPTSYTEDSNWTQLLGNPPTSVAVVDFVYRIVNSTAPLSWTVSYTPTATIDIVIATFKQGGASAPGTGLSAATAFLPSNLPQVPSGSTASGSGFHLTARPWLALNVPVANYLTRAKNEAAYWVTQLSSGDVTDPYDGNSTTEPDRGKIPHAIGIMATASPADTSLMSSGVTMLTTAAARYKTDSAGSQNFYLQPMFDAIQIYSGFSGSFGITTTLINTWYTNMNQWFPVTSPVNNWVAYDMLGQWSANSAVVNHSASLSAFSPTATVVSRLENEWNQQVVTGGSGNGAYGDAPWLCYRDGSSTPDTMNVELAGRGNLTLLVDAGYTGASVTTMNTNNIAGALTALLTQDPAGQNAAGGRQSNQNWIDAVEQCCFEVMAQKFRVSNANLAGQFQHAAMLNFNNLTRWANPQIPGTFFVCKNHFDPTVVSNTPSIGSQGTYQYMYNSDICQFTAISYAKRAANPNIVEQPCPTEIGGYAFHIVSPTPVLDYAFANAGGTHIQIALTGANQIDSNQYWTGVGFQRVGRVNWESRLGPSDNGWGRPASANPNRVSFAPTWFTAGAWTRLAQNPGTVSGAFTTTFASPGLVLCRVVWTVSGGGPVFTQNITVTPDGVLVQTTQTSGGLAAGNWGVTFPILTSDGTTSPNTWGATTTTTAIGTTPGIASATWPVSLDSIHYITVTSNTAVLTSETSCVTASGNVTPVRSVVSADTTHTTFIYPANSSDPTAASVQSGMVVTGTNTFTNSALGLSVVSGSATGTYYIGRTCASGWASTVTLSGGTVTFSAPCFFVAQLSSGVVTAIEVDRAVTATIQTHAAQSLSAYTAVTIS